MDWFVGDTHFFHANILRHCNRKWLSAEEKEKLKNNEKFYVSPSSVKAMDDELIDNINKCVDKNDVLWHLGDFCFGPPRSYFEIAKSYRERIKCKNILLIAGNHDYKEIYPLFTRVYEQHMIRHESGQKIVVNHYPLEVWQDKHRKSFMLHGHCHGTLSDRKDLLRIDVGVDVTNYKPLSFNEIVEIMNAKII